MSAGDPTHYTRLSDEELVDAMNAGEAGAFAELYQRYRQWVADLALRLTRDHDLSLEIMQEAFIALIRKFPGFELRGRLTSYLYPVVRHLAISMQQRDRKMSSRGKLPDASTSPTPHPERLDVLRRVVETLPTGQREVLLLRITHDLSLAEIAAALGIPEGTVKSRLHGALRTLREHPDTKNYFSS